MPESQLRKGTVELITLGLLERRPMYGYQIIQEVNEKTDGAFEWRQASLYPALYRLEERGCIESFWQPGAGARRRKYYRITTKGKRELASQKKEWASMAFHVNKLAFEGS